MTREFGELDILQSAIIIVFHVNLSKIIVISSKPAVSANASPRRAIHQNDDTD